MLDLGGAAAIGLGASRGSAIRAPYFAALQLRGKSTMLPKQSVGGVLRAPLHQRHLTTRLHRNNWGGIGAGLANRMVLPKRGRVMAARCQSTSGRFRSRRVMTACSIVLGAGPRLLGAFFDGCLIACPGSANWLGGGRCVSQLAAPSPLGRKWLLPAGIGLMRLFRWRCYRLHV